MPEESFRQADIENILTDLIQEGSFIYAVVASNDGLLIATAGEANVAMVAAVAATMKDLAERAHQHLTEIATRDRAGNHIVSRYFSVDKDLLLLTVKVPPGRTYRRLTSRAIRKIKQVWAA